ncbi:MAG: hypothetical protein FJX72_19215, partial [Armatimonadetes bacterium]|nr:hypothetical protein [Armatimonadota bacterium]
VLARRQGGTRYVFVPDPLGSIHHLLDSSLNKAATMVYRPYGELQSLTGVEWPMQFVGALGYYTAVANRAYVRARWLRPDLGRWQTVDPMGRASRRAYDYARNAPTQLVDPSGAWPCRTSNCCRDEHDFWESGWPAHACRGPWVECPKRATLNSCLRVMWSRADCSRLESIIREVAGICETMCTGGTYGGGTRLTGAVHCCQETDGTTRFCSMKCCSDDKLMRLWPSDKVARCALSCLIDHEQYHALECIVGSLPLSECCAYAEQVNCLLGVYRRVCATSVVPEGAASGCLAMAAYLEGCPSGVLPW